LIDLLHFRRMETIIRSVPSPGVDGSILYIIRMGHIMKIISKLTMLLFLTCLSSISAFVEPFKFMTFNVMAWPYYQIDNSDLNLHGLRNDGLWEFKNIGEMKKPTTKNIISKEEANQRQQRIISLILKQKPDLLFLQEYTFKTADQFKRLSREKLKEVPDNWPQEIGDDQFSLKTSYRGLVGFKCLENRNFGTAEAPQFKRSNQQDATAVYYNPKRYKLIASKSGCFMDEFNTAKKPFKGQFGSGSAYNLVLLKDLTNGKKVFGINIHVKVHAWGQDNLVNTYEELEKYARDFINKNNIGREEHVILAGDLNASRYNFPEQDNNNASDFIRWPSTRENVMEKNYHNFLGFQDKINNQGLLGLQLKEIATPMPTSVNCVSTLADDIDHIFISDNLIMKQSYNGARLFDILRIPCKNPNLGEDSIIAIKKAYPSEEAQRKYLEFINFNNKLRNDDKVYSDHWPKIVELDYQ